MIRGTFPSIFIQIGRSCYERGGSHPFLHNSPANFESYAKNCYAKLCKTMQNYAKTLLKYKKFEISLENNSLITTRFFRWSDFFHNNPFLISLSHLHDFCKHYTYCGRAFSLVHLTKASWYTCYSPKHVSVGDPQLMC